jgi:diadenylate cyclase
VIDVWNSLLVHGFGFRDLLDVLVVGALVYLLFNQVRGTRAVQMLLGILILLAANALARWLDLVTVHRVIEKFLFYIPFAVIVLFQNPIQRALASLGSLTFGKRTVREQSRMICREVARACFTMGARRHGALIVVERIQGLRTHAESGISIRGEVSADLLSTVFFPGTPLHDGAVVISDGQILAAGCFMPLSTQPLPLQYGTRHRAAVGITEEVDAVSVVVSEERGEVSISQNGWLETVSSPEALEIRLEELMEGRARPDGRTPEPSD